MHILRKISWLSPWKVFCEQKPVFEFRRFYFFPPLLTMSLSRARNECGDAGEKDWEYSVVDLYILFYLEVGELISRLYVQPFQVIYTTLMVQ